MYKWLGIFLVFVCLTGCGWWDKTTDAYYDYVYPTPDIDLHTEGLEGSQEDKLARIFYPADKELSALLRHLRTQNDYPRESWFKSTMRRFTWLDAAFAVDAQGNELNRYPEEGIKKIDYAKIDTEEISVGDWQIRTFIQDTKFGPEVILARPFFKGVEWQGMLAVQFDPRVFAELSPSSERMSLVMDERVLWSGDLKGISGYLQNRPWKKLLAEDISGRFPHKQKNLLWFARKAGNKWLVYITGSNSLKE